MLRAVEAVFKQFPDIERDVAEANKDPKPLITKIRKVRNPACTHAIVYIAWKYARKS